MHLCRDWPSGGWKIACSIVLCQRMQMNLFKSRYVNISSNSPDGFGQHWSRDRSQEKFGLFGATDKSLMGSRWMEGLHGTNPAGSSVQSALWLSSGSQRLKEWATQLIDSRLTLSIEMIRDSLNETNASTRCRDEWRVKHPAIIDEIGNYREITMFDKDSVHHEKSVSCIKWYILSSLQLHRPPAIAKDLTEGDAARNRCMSPLLSMPISKPFWSLQLLHFSDCGELSGK